VEAGSAGPACQLAKPIHAVLNIARVGEGGIGNPAAEAVSIPPSRGRPQGARPSRWKNEARPIAHGARTRPETGRFAAMANRVNAPAVGSSFGLHAGADVRIVGLQRG
jgi:hypothetical protein